MTIRQTTLAAALALASTPADAVEIIRQADTVLVHEAAAGLTN